MFEHLLCELNGGEVEKGRIYIIRQRFNNLCQNLYLESLREKENEIRNLVRDCTDIIINHEKNLELLYYILSCQIILYNFTYLNDCIICFIKFCEKFSQNIIGSEEDLTSAQNIFELIDNKYIVFLNEYALLDQDKNKNLLNILRDKSNIDIDIAQKVVDNCAKSLNNLTLLTDLLSKHNIYIEFDKLKNFLKDITRYFSDRLKSLDKFQRAVEEKSYSSLNTKELLDNIYFIVDKLSVDKNTMLLGRCLRYVLNNINVDPLSLAQNIKTDILVDNLISRIITESKDKNGNTL